MLNVRIAGRLGMADLGRLEHACAPALTSQPSNLELDLRGVTHIDAAGDAFLERMSQRGARITALPPSEIQAERIRSLKRNGNEV